MEPLLVTIAAAQCGVFSRVQALAAGYSDRRIRHLLAIGTWLRCHQGIFRLSGTPLTFDVSAWIATLAADPHAVLSHRVPESSTASTAPLRPFIGSLVLARRVNRDWGECQQLWDRQNAEGFAWSTSPLTIGPIPGFLDRLRDHQN